MQRPGRLVTLKMVRAAMRLSGTAFLALSLAATLQSYMKTHGGFFAEALP